MKKTLMYLFASSMLLSQVALAAGTVTSPNKHSDPIGDVDNKPVAWCQDLETDLKSTDFKREGDEYVVQMEVTKEIKKTDGYKEYYFWLDITHDSNKGYTPYLPDSAAWPDMFANYRIFYSVNVYRDENGSRPEERIAIQNCFERDCSRDEGMYSTNDVKVSVVGNTVTFRWPVNLLPEMAKHKKIRVGYTTYYDMQMCNGEDDSPQWGRNAWEIKL